MEQNKALVISIIDRMKTVLGVRMDKDISDKLDGSRSLVSVWKSRGVIPFNECVQLAIDYNVSLDWLILGRGKKDVADPVFGEGLGEHLSEIPFADETGESNQSEHSWYVPVTWIEQEGLVPGDLVAVTVRGDAMAPTMSNGEVVLVNYHGRVSGEGVALLALNTGDVFRRIQTLADGSIRLSCDNPAYAPEIVPAAELGRLKIKGYCHALVKALR